MISVLDVLAPRLVQPTILAELKVPIDDQSRTSATRQPTKMRYIHTEESLKVPDDGTSYLLELMQLRSYEHQAKGADNAYISAVKVHIKSRIVTVEGPRGML